MADASKNGVTELFELLDEWSRFRAEPPWTRKRPGSAGSSQRKVDLLQALKKRLEEIGGPACALPIQGLQSDLQRLATMLQQNT
jgi:hypothetical protein